MPAPSISIVICTLERPQEAKAVVARLLSQMVEGDELIVVDQNAADDEYPSPTTVIHVPPSGPSGARNIGAAKATKDVLLFVEDDAELPGDDFVERHRRWYQHEFVQVVHGGVVQKGETLPDSPQTQSHPDPVQLYNQSPNCQGIRTCTTIASGNFSIRRSLFFTVDGFDERFQRLVDRDLGVRLFRAGAFMVYDPDALLVHLRLPTGGTRSAQSPSSFAGLWRPEPHPAEYLLHRVHWPGIQVMAWICWRLKKVWRLRNWRRPLSCLLQTVRLVICIRQGRRLAKKAFRGISQR